VVLGIGGTETRRANPMLTALPMTNRIHF
jgi:hypothetical protein